MSDEDEGAYNHEENIQNQNNDNIISPKNKFQEMDAQFDDDNEDPKNSPTTDHKDINFHQDNKH